MDISLPAALDLPLDRLAGLVEVAAVLDDGGTPRAHRGVLVRIVSRGNVNRAGDLLLVAGECDRLAVVAGAGGDDAARGQLALQRSNQVQPAPNLESTRRVVVLVLDVHIGLQRVGQQWMSEEWRRLQRTVDELAGGAYVRERNRFGSSRSVDTHNPPAYVEPVPTDQSNLRAESAEMDS